MLERSDFSSATESEARQAALDGNVSAGLELDRREKFSREIWDNHNARQGAAGGQDIPLWPFALGAIGIVLYGVVQAMFAGTTWLSQQPGIGALFPAPGDPTIRVVISFFLVIGMLSGGLLLLARAVRFSRLRVLSVPLAVMAIIMVPLVMITFYETATAVVMRL